MYKNFELVNIIQELTEKYSRKYSEDSTKNVNSPGGKYVYQSKNGTKAQAFGFKALKTNKKGLGKITLKS